MTPSSFVLALALAAGGEPAPATPSACRTIDELPVGDASLVHERCGQVDAVKLCRKGACEPLPCVEAATVPPDAWVDSILPIRDGKVRGALAVYRVGEGGHLELRPVLPVRGEPVCIGGPKVDGAMKQAQDAARKKLRSGEHLGGRGGQLRAERDRILITRGIYAEHDAGCCPTAGTVRVELQLRGGRLHLRGVKRGNATPIHAPPGHPSTPPATEKTK